MELEEQHVVTVFCKGAHASASQASKYSKSGVHYTMNDGRIEHAQCHYANNVLRNIYVSGETYETEYSWSWWPRYWFGYLFSIVAMWWLGITGASPWHTKTDVMELGGPTDVFEYVTTVRRAIAEHPGHRVVLFGHSLGASTVISSLCSFTSEEHALIDFVLLEAPFDTIEHVVYKRMGRFIGRINLTILSIMTNYNSEHATPIQYTRSMLFPRQLHIAFVMSHADTVVPRECTEKLIQSLRKCRQEKLSILELQQSNHCAMSLGSGSDQRRYVDFVNRLYEGEK
jgi:hypothetical protein